VIELVNNIFVSRGGPGSACLLVCTTTAHLVPVIAFLLPIARCGVAHAPAPSHARDA
jgi:hypothetical protein